MSKTGGLEGACCREAEAAPKRSAIGPAIEDGAISKMSAIGLAGLITCTEGRGALVVSERGVVGSRVGARSVRAVSVERPRKLGDVCNAGVEREFPVPRSEGTEERDGLFVTNDVGVFVAVRRISIAGIVGAWGDSVKLGD